MSMCGDPDYTKAFYLKENFKQNNDDLLKQSYTVIDLS
jgi:hypothetical protein